MNGSILVYTYKCRLTKIIIAIMVILCSKEEGKVRNAQKETTAEKKKKISGEQHHIRLRE